MFFINFCMHFISNSFNKMYYFKTLILLLSFFYCACSYRILAICQVATLSHYRLASKLSTEIAKKGHEVTFVSPYAQKVKIKNLKEIPIESLQTVFQMEALSMLDLESATVLQQTTFLTDVMYNFTRHLLSSEEIHNLLISKEHYDAVILHQSFNEALSGLAYHFQAPLILFSPMPLYVSESFLLSHPASSSYVPNILTEYTGHINFWQRLKKSFHDVSIILYYLWFILPKHRQLVYEYIPGKPDLHDFLNNASLLLINSHVSINEAVPLVPNAIEIGGFHIESPKPLPEHLGNFLSNSVNGVILFSMGSITRSCSFPKEKRDVFIKTFSKFKENFLWKWECADIPELPPNVKTMKWIPQADVLAHPNVKAFISHGGLLSTMESVYYAVPIIGIPIFADQKINMAVARSYEYAIEVPYNQITEEKLSIALTKILSEQKYKENIARRSKIMRDRPTKPLETALYWIEYVIRHQGAPHLRYAGMDLNWYQRNLLDIVVFVIAAIVLPIVTLAYILKIKKTLKTNCKVKNQ